MPIQLRNALLCTAIVALQLSALPLPAEDPPPPAPNPQAGVAPVRPPRVLPGAKPGGTILLPTGWSLQPAGRQIKLGDFPVNIALHPSEPYAAILHAGYGEHEVAIVDLKTLKVVSRSRVDQAFYGLCFSPDGGQVYCSGGEFEVVHRFQFDKGYLTRRDELRIVDEKVKFIPGGLSVSQDGQQLFVCGTWGDGVAIVSTADPQRIERVALAKDSYPYLALPTADGQRLYVALWGGAGVAVVNLETKQVEATWPVDSHPTEMLLAAKEELLFVSCANSNHVWVLDTKTGRPLEVISGALYAKAPLGATPNSIALSPDEKVLLIANANTNNVAVVDIAERGRSRSLGFIPVGWYPTSVRFERGGQRILVANGKGLASQANPQGPNPIQPPPRTIEQYIAGLFQGTLAVIDNPGPADMAKYTRSSFACSPLDPENKPRTQGRAADNPIPAKVGDPSPIKHCIYVIKENRTYDQVFGDLREGNGDPNLCIFGEEITPNHHALAREFVLLDNFYVESEVSADGHEWSMAAYATDFTEKAWPLSYRGSRQGKIGYAAEGNFPIAFSAAGYIWDRCREAGVSYRSYGEFVANGPKPGDPGRAKVKSLEGHFDPLYRSYDLDYLDVDRVARFVEELRRFEQEGAMPRFIVLRLPNDHTYGTSPGKRTPIAMVADNDLALGRLVEAISKSKFWKETAIFVVEDDAQNGSDHVDAHRTVALAISPYIRRGTVDSNMYSTASMLRTMELILGLKPMTQFDAAALPMYASFQATPDLKPYAHLPARVPLDTLNKVTAWGAKESLALDFSREDAADDLLLNDIVWRSVRGPNSPMPPPVRAGFVFVHGEEEEDEEEGEASSAEQPSTAPAKPERD